MEGLKMDQKKSTLTVRLDETFLERFQEYLREKESAEATIRKYLSDVRKFYHYLGRDRVVDKYRIRQYRQYLTEHYKGTSANSMLAALNQFFAALGLEELKVRRLKIQRQLYQNEEKFLSRQEYFKLLGAARRRGKEELALIMETICSTGIRVSELRFFTISNIRTGKIIVWNKGKERIVILPGKMQKRLLRFAREKGYRSGPVFRGRTGRPVDRTAIWRAMKGLAVETGIDPARIFPHNLRHLFARTFYQITRNLVQLADVLGHSSIEVTRIYTIGSLEEWRQSISRLDLIGQKNTT